ncbi:unnamed protein product [Tetraodon nigroviridis]|uniref:(spotted green pufferfish) hypothetical protein n=1 Tax=Tetraodon nigroviridis TaxID=99883 RepID=Q4S2B1_TETNG|nr:unnamed protein product [Tetraodon nigroviridis]
MAFAGLARLDGLSQRCQKEAALRFLLIMSCLLLVLSVSLYPGLWAIGVRLHSAFTGSYVPGHHSVLLVNSPNEQAAKDIGRYAAEPQQSLAPRTGTGVFRSWWESHPGSEEVEVIILAWMRIRYLPVKVERTGAIDPLFKHLATSFDCPLFLLVFLK